MALNINNCIKFYLYVNISSENRCVNDTAELKLILNKWYQKASWTIYILYYSGLMTLNVYRNLFLHLHFFFNRAKLIIEALKHCFQLQSLQLAFEQPRFELSWFTYMWIFSVAFCRSVDLHGPNLHCSRVKWRLGIQVFKMPT